MAGKSFVNNHNKPSMHNTLTLYVSASTTKQNPYFLFSLSLFLIGFDFDFDWKWDLQFWAPISSYVPFCPLSTSMS